MRHKKRAIIIGLLIIICFIIQTTVIHYISLGSIIPNLLIVITSSIGFMRGKKEGLFAGFLCGLLIDIFYSDLMGFQAFFYMIIGYGNGFFQRLFYDDDIKLPLILIGVSEFLYGLGIYVFSFLLESKFDFRYYLYNIILPELVYTFLATIILYQIIRKINNWLEEDERRSANKFV
ncbi:MAG: rod shape-determining protein MreD [Eubacteriales bacterium]